MTHLYTINEPGYTPIRYDLLSDDDMNLLCLQVVKTFRAYLEHAKIDVLLVSTRAENVLRRNDLRTIKAFIEYGRTHGGYLALRGSGPSVNQELMQEFRTYNKMYD